MFNFENGHGGTASRPYNDVTGAREDGQDEFGEAFVFRDFEGSLVQSLRDQVAKNPYVMSIVFFAVILFWTVVMSAATTLHGNNNIFLNLTPHVAHFTIVLGIFFYPLRLIWVPILAYMIVFSYVMLQTAGLPYSWINTPSMSYEIALVLFVINACSGVIMGVVNLGLFKWLLMRYRPYVADSAFCLSAMGVFMVVGLGQVLVTAAYINQLPAETLALLTAGQQDIIYQIFRIIRGGVVIGAFFLATVERVPLRDVPSTLVYIASFAVLGTVHSFGIELFPMMDATALTMFLVLFLRIDKGLFACVLGVPIYSLMTGNFLNDSFDGDSHILALNIYTVLALLSTVVVASIRSRTSLARAQKDASIQRLNRARFIAGFGLFAINLKTGHYRLDDSAEQVMGVLPTGDLPDLINRFDLPHRAPVVAAMQARAGGGVPHRFRLVPQAKNDLTPYILLYIWYDETQTREQVAYGLVLDVSIEHDRNKRLTEALNALSDQQQQQRQLFSIVSHELRTPASVLSMLIDDLADTADQTKIIRQMRGTTDHLLSVMGDMRQAVNPEMNLPIKRIAYVPADVGEGVIHSLDLTAKDNGILLRLNLGKDARQPRIGDVTRVRQALTNLAKNAVLHSNGRTVTLSYAVENEGADAISQWTVEDDGTGIPAKDVARMFQPFERGGDDPQKRVDGSGLGLYIARTAMELLGGSLTHRQPDGGGTAFVIRLPEPEAEQSDLGPTAPAIIPVDLPRLNILLVEDNALVGEVMRARLEKEFGTVNHAANGAEALRMIAEVRPNLVITDLFMPELDGDDMIRRLRAMGFDKPIIGISAAVVGAETDRFYQAGADAVMEKPMDSKLLRSYLTEGFPARDLSYGPAQGDK